MARRPPGAARRQTRSRPAADRTLSLRGYARARGVSHTTVWEAVQNGQIRLTPAGRIDPAEADATWYRRHLMRQDGQRSGAEATARNERAQLTRATAQTVLMHRRVVQARARLIDRTAAQADVSAAVMEFWAWLGRQVIDPDIMTAVRADLGDLAAEASKVTRL